VKSAPVRDFQDFVSFIKDLESPFKLSASHISLYPPIYEDLYSLYFHVRKSKVISILEYGSGWSTLALALGLSENCKLYGNYIKTNLRHPNAFQLMTVDASEYFLKIATDRARTVLPDGIIPVLSKSRIIEYSGQICHVYSKVPNFTADLVYLDGPDANQVEGNYFGRGVDFGDQNKIYGLPMSADVLITENFFWPGSKIIVDGRGANARFILNHLTRSWQYEYDAALDQHLFTLSENAWGRYSKILLDFKEQY
jgi:hypothetical protein